MGNTKLAVLDLFAGAGGLSLGFEQTEMFEVKAAVEINRYAAQTYHANKAHVKIYPDITILDYEEIKQNYGKIDVVIGGPPCQGFSNANRQKNHLISGNNSLVKHFIKAIEELEPDAFVMENVKTMSSESHKFFLVKGEKEEITRLGVTLNENEEIFLGDMDDFVLEVFELGVQQRDVSRYMLQKEVFSKLNSLFRVRMNASKLNAYLAKEKRFFRSLAEDCNRHHPEALSEMYQDLWYRMVDRLNRCLNKQQVDQALLTDIQLVLEIQKVLGKVDEVQKHDLEYELFTREAGFYVRLTSYNVFEYIMRKFTDLGYDPQDNVLKAVEFGVPQQRERLFVVGVKSDAVADKKASLLPKGFLTSKEYYTIADAFEDIENIPPVKARTDEGVMKTHATGKLDKRNRLYDYLNDVTELFNHITTDTRQTAMERYELLLPGQSFKDLSDDYKTTYSDPERTQKTIYHRLDYGIPSRTVVNVRKSMWVHPRLHRAVSVREAARLQSFPDSYKFLGSKDSQYQQVGNAVPPLLGRAVAEQLLRVMGYNVHNSLADMLGRSLFALQS